MAGDFDVERRGINRRALLVRGGALAGAVVLGPSALSALISGEGLAGAHGGFDSLGLDDPFSARLIAGRTLPPPPIISRAQWGADESLRDSRRGFSAITKAVVHHTVTQNGDPDPAARVRAIYQFHVEGNGWSDIGYNFLLDTSGRIYEGRWARNYSGGEVHDGEDTSGRGVIGAHAFNHNTGSMGVALLGTYSSSSTTMTDAALRSLVHLLAWKFGPRELDPEGADTYRRGDGEVVRFPNIAGHRDVVQTGCPGDGLYRRLSEVRVKVADELSRGLVGYRVVGAEGSIVNFGNSPTFGATADIGDLPRSGVRGAPIKGAASTPSGDGAWLVGADGGIFSFGDAAFLGSMGGARLNKPIVGMAAVPGSSGYWMVASDGGIFSFGSAGFYGSTGALPLNQPIVGMAPHPTGRGYWLVARDGGVFSFGSSLFFGSTGGIVLNRPVVAMAALGSGLGYWLVAEDGGVFSFGMARFHGSTVGRRGFTAPARSIVATPSGNGYWVLDAAGTVHPFGDAPNFGGGIGAGSRPAAALVPIVRQ